MGVWRSLTRRGKTMLVAGVVLTSLAALAGARALLPWSLLFVFLPVLALLMIAIVPTIAACRTVTPLHTQRGNPAQVNLVLSVKRGTVAVASFRDQIPPRLGSSPSFEAHKVFSSWKREVGYLLAARHRGAFELGPLSVQLSDPLGLTRATRTFDSRQEILVTPKIVELPGVRLAAGWGSSGEETPHRTAVSGQDDVLVREHQYGDDLRRVHWRSTAKHGELMVRREEHSWDPSVCVLLDSRASAYADEESFEWAVDAAASICEHLIRSRLGASLVTADEAVAIPRVDDPQIRREAITLALTKLTPSPRTELTKAVSLLPNGGRPQTLIAILGKIGPTDATRLVENVAPKSRMMVFHLSPTADETKQLAQRNWRYVPVNAETSLPKAWVS